jgi:hypothetical protein
MSMGIALWTRDSAIKLKMDGMELTKHALNNIQKPSVAYRNAGNADNYWKMRVSDKENEDLSWLL